MCILPQPGAGPGRKAASPMGELVFVCNKPSRGLQLAEQAKCRQSAVALSPFHPSTFAS